MTEEKKPPRTGAQLLAEIEEKAASVEIATLRRKARVVWFPKLTAEHGIFLYHLVGASEARQGESAEETSKRQFSERVQILDSMQPTIWLRGKAGEPQAVPFSPDMLIFEMFEDSVEYRVYAAPRAGTENKALTPALYHLNKTQPHLSQDAITYDMMTTLIAKEWAQVDGEISSTSRERTAVIEYLQSLDDDYSVKQAARDIADLEHYAEEDEEDGEEEVECSCEAAEDAEPWEHATTCDAHEPKPEAETPPPPPPTPAVAAVVVEG